MAVETTQTSVIVTEVVSEISVIVQDKKNNGTNESEPFHWEGNLPSIPWLQISVMIIVLIFGLVANLSIIFIVLKNKRLRSTPNIIVVNLTVGDLLCLVFNLPFIIDYHMKTDKHWIFGAFMCKFAHNCMITSGCITVYSLMALAIERFLAIAWPLRNRDNSRFVRASRSCFLSPTWQIVLVIWLAAFIVGTPVWFTAKLLSYPFTDKQYCIYLNHGSTTAQGYEVFRVVVAFAIPLAVIVIAHTLTARALVKSIQEPVTGATAQVCSTSRQTPRVRSRVKLAVVISVLSAMFFLMWLPFYAFTMYLQFFHFKMDEQEVSHIVVSLLHWKDIPVYILSCLNPIMLYILSTRFREHLFKDCFCCFGKQRFDWRPAETFSSLKSSFLTANTFRGRSTVARRSTSPNHFYRSRTSSNELTKL